MPGGGSAGAIRAGRAYYELYTEQNPLKKGLSQADALVKGSLKRIASEAASIGARMAGAVTAAVAAIASPAAALKLFASTGAELENIARRTGASASALSAFGYAAKQTGSDLASMAALLVTLRDKTMGAARGSEQAQLAFFRLGINFLELSTMRPEDQLRLVADRLTAIPNPAFRAAAAIELLGSADMLPTLARLRELEAESGKLGLTLSEKTTAAAKKFDETMTKLWESLKQIGITIGEALAPAIQALAEQAIAILGPIREWIAAHGELVVGATAVVVALAAMSAALTAYNVVAWAAAAATGVLAVAWAVLTSPITLAIAAIAAATYGIIKLTEVCTGGEWSLKQLGETAKAVAASFKREWEKTLNWFAKRWIDVQEILGVVSAEEARLLRAQVGRAPQSAGFLPAGGGGAARPVGFAAAGPASPAAAVVAALQEVAEANGPAGLGGGELSAAERQILRGAGPLRRGALPGIGGALFHIKGIGANDVRSKEGFKALTDSLSQINSPLLALQQRQFQLQQRQWVDIHQLRLNSDNIQKVGV